MVSDTQCTVPICAYGIDILPRAAGGKILSCY
jgi:hypothetical protein